MSGLNGIPHNSGPNHTPPLSGSASPSSSPPPSPRIRADSIEYMDGAPQVADTPQPKSFLSSCGSAIVSAGRLFAFVCSFIASAFFSGCVWLFHILTFGYFKKEPPPPETEIVSDSDSEEEEYASPSRPSTPALAGEPVGAQAVSPVLDNEQQNSPSLPVEAAPSLPAIPVLPEEEPAAQPVSISVPRAAASSSSSAAAPARGGASKEKSDRLLGTTPQRAARVGVLPLPEVLKEPFSFLMSKVNEKTFAEWMLKENCAEDLFSIYQDFTKVSTLTGVRQYYAMASFALGVSRLGIAAADTKAFYDKYKAHSTKMEEAMKGVSPQTLLVFFLKHRSFHPKMLHVVETLQTKQRVILENARKQLPLVERELKKLDITEAVRNQSLQLTQRLKKGFLGTINTALDGCTEDFHHYIHTHSKIDSTKADYCLKNKEWILLLKLGLGGRLSDAENQAIDVGINKERVAAEEAQKRHEDETSHHIEAEVRVKIGELIFSLEQESAAASSSPKEALPSAPEEDIVGPLRSGSAAASSPALDALEEEEETSSGTPSVSGKAASSSYSSSVMPAVTPAAIKGSVEENVDEIIQILANKRVWKDKKEVNTLLSPLVASLKGRISSFTFIALAYERNFKNMQILTGDSSKLSRLVKRVLKPLYAIEDMTEEKMAAFCKRMSLDGNKKVEKYVKNKGTLSKKPEPKFENILKAIFK